MARLKSKTDENSSVLVRRYCLEKHWPVLSATVVMAETLLKPAIRYGSNAQTMTALGTSGRNHLATALGAHAYQKTVGPLAAHDRRLECAFHFTKSLMSMKKSPLFDLLSWPFVKSNFFPGLWISCIAGSRMLIMSAAGCRRFLSLHQIVCPVFLIVSGLGRS